jgi:hypothetical protein
MISESQANTVIERLANDLPGFIAGALVDLDSGMTLGMFTARPGFDLSGASAYNSELVKQKRKIMAALNLQTNLEDITMTLADQVHVISIVDESTFFYLAADRSGSNLAIIRNAIAKHASALAG